MGPSLNLWKFAVIVNSLIFARPFYSNSSKQIKANLYFFNAKRIPLAVKIYNFP